MFLLSFGHFGNVTAAESDPIWTWPAPELGHLTSPPSISQNGTIYIGTYSYTAPQGYALTAINPDGTKKWVFPIDSTDSDFTPSTVGSDGVIYYTAGSKLYAINPNGIQKWVFTSPTTLTASALGQDGTIYMGSLYCISPVLFYALNSADGTIKWTSSSVYGGSSPAIARDGTIYVYGCDSNLHALDANGNLKWTFFLNGGSFNPPTVDADGTVYAGGSGRLTAINPDGSQKWIAPVQGVANGTSIAPDGTLYVATETHEGKLYAINKDGTQKWIFSPQTQPNTISHPAIGSDGTIYVGGYGDKFYALNPNGTEKWSFGTVGARSPALTADGRLMIAAYDNTLYSFNLTSGGLATSPWPMLSHDPQHTGRQSTTTTLTGSISLPKTGQTKCYDTIGNEIACAGTGQDGETKTGIAWPSPRFLNNGDGTITDKLTGLMWLKDANCARTIGHDPDGSGNGSMGWLNALAFVSGLNHDTYDISSCASYTNHYSNWHLPNSNELASIVNYTVPDNSAWLKSVGFTNVMPNYYWSSTSGTYPYSGYRYDGSILVDMQSGGTGGHYPKTYSPYNPYFTWPTRIDERVVGSAPVWKTGQTTCYGAYGDVVACAGTGQDGEIRSGIEWPAPRFKDNADGTVTDNLTGLMWTKSDTVLGGINRSWQDILNLVKDMNAGLRENFGYSDWRLPNIVEITSLLSRQYDKPVLPEGHPFDLVYGYGVTTWTSTSVVGLEQSAWMTDTSWGPRIPNDKSGGGGNGWPVRTVDTDGDGIPDWYEDKYGLNKNDPADAVLDKDGDGLTNAQEFALGTDPRVKNPAPVINVSPTSLDFGNILLTENSIAKSVTITNTGTANLALGVLSLTGTNPGDFLILGNTCDSMTLVPNTTCSFAVAFNPTLLGQRTAAVNVPSVDASITPRTVSLQGIGGSAPPPPVQTSFWTEISSGLGALTLRASPSTSATILKQLPDGWAIEVTNTFDNSGNIKISDGYRWYQVKDITDGTIGWMAAGKWTNGALSSNDYLKYDPAKLGIYEGKAKILTDTSRVSLAGVIKDAIDHYYRSTNNSKTLEGASYGNGLLSFLSTATTPFPEQLIAAIVLQESGGIDFKNDWIAGDFGFGVMQNNTYRDTRGQLGGASLIQIPSCEGYVGRDNCFTPGPYYSSIPPKQSYKSNIYYRYYINSQQSIYANIKDGLAKLHTLYKESTDPKVIPDDHSPWTVDSYTVSVPEMRMLRTVRGYNGFGFKGKDLNGDGDYYDPGEADYCYRFVKPDGNSYLSDVAGQLSKVIGNFTGMNDAPNDLGAKMKVVELRQTNISLCSPGVLRIVDGDGKVTGRVDTTLRNEVPTAVYDTEGGKAAVVYLTDNSYKYQVVGTEAGIYSLYIDNTTPAGITTIELHNIPLALGEVYNYQVNWDAIARGEKGVSVAIDRKGDGNDVETFTVGANVNDTQAPQTTPTIVGTSGQNGWYISDVTVSFSASDGSGVGVKSTSYSLDNGPWQTYDSVSPFVITTEGTHTIQYYSTDFFGNKEGTRTLALKIDKTAPEAFISVDQSTKDLKIAGVDNLGTVAIVKDAAGNYVVTDDAGHTAKLFFKKIYTGTLLTFAQLTGIQYDKTPVFTLPKTSFLYVWDSKTTPPLLLSQTIAVNDTFVIQVVYDKKTNKTTVVVLKKGVPFQKLTYSGLRIVQVTSKKGIIGYQL
jgi:hypothetical protein